MDFCAIGAVRMGISNLLSWGMFFARHACPFPSKCFIFETDDQVSIEFCIGDLHFCQRNFVLIRYDSYFICQFSEKMLHRKRITHNIHIKYRLIMIHSFCSRHLWYGE